MMAEIFARRTGLPAGERELWWIDPEAAVATELAAAQNITRSLALHQTHRGVALRDRLPHVAALFEAGLISEMLVRNIVWRTYLINDPDAMAAVDTELADQITRWGPLSMMKTEQAIDALVDKHDPAAIRRSRQSSQGCTVDFGSPSDEPGFTSMWAKLYAHDAAVIEQCVNDMAHSVCDDDPRSIDERRTAALRALAQSSELACACPHPDCTRRANQQPTTNAVIYAVADHTTIDTTTPTPTPKTPAGTATATPMRRPPTGRPPRSAGPPRNAGPPHRRSCSAPGSCPQPCSAGCSNAPPSARSPTRPQHPRTAPHPLHSTGRLRPLPRPDLPLPRLRPPRHRLRPRPHRALAHRTHPPVKPQGPLPISPADECAYRVNARSAVRVTPAIPIGRRCA